MKTTDYFKYRIRRSDRSNIKYKWINYVLKHPIKKEIQSDGRIRLWAKIKTVNKYLRVILLNDGETVHNTFFDRNYKEAKQK